MHPPKQVMRALSSALELAQTNHVVVDGDEPLNIVDEVAEFRVMDRTTVELQFDRFGENLRLDFARMNLA